MSRLGATARGDVRLQVRNGFYWAAGFVALCCILLLNLVDAETLAWLIPPFVFSNLLMNTFYFIGDETVGDWQVFDRNMTLLYIPSAYGTIASTVAVPPSNPEEITVGAGRALTEADIAAERAESEAFNNARIERELAQMEAQIAELRASMGNNRP